MRDVIVETRVILSSHLDECSRRHAALQADIAEIKSMLTGYVTDARMGRRELHARLDKAMWGAVTALGGIAMALAAYLIQLIIPSGA